MLSTQGPPLDYVPCKNLVNELHSIHLFGFSDSKHYFATQVESQSRHIFAELGTKFPGQVSLH